MELTLLPPSPGSAGVSQTWSPAQSQFEPSAHSVPKKVRKAALRSALSLRQTEGAITVVDEIEVPEFKTKIVIELLKKLSLGGAGVLIVIDERNDKLERSGRNLPGVAVVRVEGLNVYDVLRHPSLLLTRSAVAGIEARLGPERKKSGADAGEAGS